VDASLVTELTALQVSMGDDDAARQLTLEDTKVDLDRLTVATSEPLSLDLSGSALMRAITAALPMANGETLDAQVDQVTVGELALASKGETFKSAADIAIEGIAIRTDGELPQAIDVSGVTVGGLKVDPAQAIEIATIAVDQLNAEITDGILALGEGENAESSDDVAAATASPSTPFRLDQASVSSGSVIKVTDASVEPPMKLEVVIENAKVGPIDTGAPDTRTQIDLGTAINEDAAIKVLGWASPLLPAPAFDLSADVSKMPLPPLSPYVSSAVGLNIDSGTLNAVAKATARDDALKGQIDILIDDLFLEPVSDEVDKEIESSYGVSANFATGILKDDKGRIDLGFPVSGSVKEPKIDYSEVISKAIGGALASLFPLNWFGNDGSSFKILPVTFGPGSAELTGEGEAASDEVGKILIEKPQLNIRVCGKATAGDLIVLRGGEVPAPTPMGEESDELPDADDAEGGESGGTSNAPTAEQPTQALAKPSQQEVDQLLELAIQRGQVVRQYLTGTHGVIADRMSECRTSYSIEDGKPPRAEFRF
jgi:hypothetical protein